MEKPTSQSPLGSRIYYSTFAKLYPRLAQFDRYFPASDREVHTPTSILWAFIGNWGPGWEAPNNLDLAPFVTALNSFQGLAVLEKAIDVHLQLLVLSAEDSILVAKPH